MSKRNARARCARVREPHARARVCAKRAQINTMMLIMKKRNARARARASAREARACAKRTRVQARVREARAKRARSSDVRGAAIRPCEAHHFQRT